jgi:zinc transporter ZupT
VGALLLSLATFFSTLIGGLFGLRYRDHLNLIMGFTAGVLVGLTSFDLLPEVFRLVYTLFFTIPPVGLPYYLGFFAGFLLYIGASDILPQAHSNKSTAFTLALTVLGVLFAFVVTRFA